MPEEKRQPPQPPSRTLAHPRVRKGLFLIGVIILGGFLSWRFTPALGGFIKTLFIQHSQPAQAALNGIPITSTPTFSTPSPPINTLTPTALTHPTITASSTDIITPQNVTSPNNLPNSSAGYLILSVLDGNYYHLIAFDPQHNSYIRLTTGEWDDINPAVSPDQKTIAFASNRDGYWDLYLLDLTNRQVSQLTNTPEYDAAPSWSPDGKWLAYESYPSSSLPDNNLEIFIRSINPEPSANSQPLQLTNQSGADFSPVWSPSGRQIAFVSQRSGNNEIWIANLDSVEDRYQNISHYPRSPNQNPQWSADGKWLVWDTTIEGVSWIVAWDTGQPAKPPAPITPGDHPHYADNGHSLYFQFQTPNHAYFGAYSFPDLSSSLPLQPLPSRIKGMSWLNKSPSQPLENQFEAIPQPRSAPRQEVALTSPSNIPGGRQRVIPLENVHAPFPLLQDWVNESFQAWRAQTNRLSGWDYLSQLENAYIPLSSPPIAALDEEWFYTGRAIALESGALNSGWLISVREEYGAEIFWRLYLKTRLQDGSLGEPLHDLPFDLTARYRGDPIAYDQGGKQASVSPAGYYIDLTELALRYGWERLPALLSWRASLPNTRFNQFIARDGLTWYEAMLELYPPEALYTATPLPPPTATALPTPFTTHTPTATLPQSTSVTPFSTTPSP